MGLKAFRPSQVEEARRAQEAIRRQDQDRVKKIKELRASGLSQREIARKFKTTVKSVRRALLDGGQPLPPAISQRYLPALLVDTHGVPRLGGA